MDSIFREEMLTEELHKRYTALCNEFDPRTVLPPHPQLVKTLSESSSPSGLSQGIDDLGEWVDNTVKTYEFVCTLWNDAEWRTVMTTIVGMNDEGGLRGGGLTLEGSGPKRRTAGSYSALRLVDERQTM